MRSRTAQYSECRGGSLVSRICCAEHRPRHSTGLNACDAKGSRDAASRLRSRGEVAGAVGPAGGLRGAPLRGPCSPSTGPHDACDRACRRWAGVCARAPACGRGLRSAARGPRFAAPLRRTQTASSAWAEVVRAVGGSRYAASRLRSQCGGHWGQALVFLSFSLTKPGVVCDAGRGGWGARGGSGRGPRVRGEQGPRGGVPAEPCPAAHAAGASARTNATPTVAPTTVRQSRPPG